MGAKDLKRCSCIRESESAMELSMLGMWAIRT